MKRLLLILTLGCLLLTGCGARRHYTMRDDLGLYFTNMDEVVDTIRQALVRRDGTITVTCRAKHDYMEEFGTIVRELMELALTETNSPQEGDYLRCQYGGCEMQYTARADGDAYSYTLTIVPQYYTTAKQETQVTAKVQTILSDLAFDRHTSDYEKVRSIYEYVIANTRYDEIHAKNPNHHLKSTAYAALVQGQAVCQGYASAMYRLLREAGVSTRVITGRAGEDGEYHAWNLVCIDGVYYHLDATWDDQRGTADCFLRCEASFSDHIRDAAFADAAFDQQYPMAEQDYPCPERSFQNEEIESHRYSAAGVQPTALRGRKAGVPRLRPKGGRQLDGLSLGGAGSICVVARHEYHRRDPAVSAGA